jgi:heterodisulfide reductase subunit C
MEHGKEEKAAGLAFPNMVISRLGGETITHCYQCGTCASSCPVAKINPRFNPREIIKLSLLGEKEEVISSDTIWLCCSCYNCQERCPQKVEIADLIYALRNIAFEEQNSPDIYLEFVSALMNNGRIVPVSKFIEKKRPVYGLPPLQPTGIEALNKILSAIRFGAPLQKEEAK